MIEHVVCPLFSYQAPSFFRASRADHGHPRRTGELHGCNPHTTARPVHTDHFTGTSLRPLQERAVGCGVRYVDRCTLSERGSLRQRMDLGFFAQDLLSIRAAERASRVYPVSHSHTGHPFADSFHHTSTVCARCVGSRGLGVNASTNVGLDRVDPDSVDPDHALSWARFQIWDLF